MPSQTERKIEQILAEDPKLKRAVEINIEFLTTISRIPYGKIDCPYKESKILWKRQSVEISGSE